MCGSRVGFWEGRAATELQPYPLQRVPVLRIPEGTLLLCLRGTPDRLAQLTMADDAGPLLEGLEVGHLPRLMTFPVCLMLPADGGCTLIYPKKKLKLEDVTSGPSLPSVINI